LPSDLLAEVIMGVFTIHELIDTNIQQLHSLLVASFTSSSKVSFHCMELADPNDGMPSVAWELYLGHMANAPDMENFLQVLLPGNSWPCELLGFRAQGFNDLIFQTGFRLQGISIYAAMRRERESEREI
jgi:hypothetical protein